MSYGLKYMQYVGKDGARVLIRVYEKGWTGRAYGMAHVTSAGLQLVGGREDVLSPVIKTAFSFSLVDAWDEGTTQADGVTCVNQMLEKCGRWEEFFTPDATKFKIEVAGAAPGELPVVVWTGFVTPDSWSENLIYHGSVTITARDMIGALAETEFNLTGRVSVMDVISGALTACQCPMPLTYQKGHFLVNESGVSILKHNFVASTFKGDKWLDALQDTLESLGLVLRWNGRNGMVLTSLRYLSEDTQGGYHEMEFVSRSGLRELSPALKYITEVFDVERIEHLPPDPGASQFTATGGTITCGGSGTGAVTGVVKEYNLVRDGEEGWAGNLAIPMYGTAAPGIPARGMFIPCQAHGTNEVEYRNPRIAGRPFKFKLSLDGSLVLVNDGGTDHATFGPYSNSFWGITDISVRVECTASGVTNYLNDAGVWVSEETYLYLEVDEEIAVPMNNAGEDYRIVVRRISMGGTGRPVAPLVAPLLLSIAPDEEYPEPTEFKTTTEYDMGNNVTISREPKIGSANLIGPMDFYENVLAYDGAVAENQWNWPDEEDFYPLAVMIQAQAVCYHSAPASVFTGTAHDGEMALPGFGLEYYGRDCVIVSGTYDFCAGFITQLCAREVYEWADVWGTFAPEYSVRTGTGKGSTDATGPWGGGNEITIKGSFNNDFSDDFEKTQ